MVWSVRWMAIAAVALALGIEPLLLTTDAAISAELPVKSPAGMAEAMSLQQPSVLLAQSTTRRIRPNRLRARARDLELQGRFAADGCITNEIQRSCNRLVAIESSLLNLCLASASTCPYYNIFMSNKAQLIFSKAQLGAVQ